MSCRIGLEQIAMHMAAASEGRPSRLSAHVASCPECSRKASLLQETDRLLDGVGLEEPPDGLWEKVASRLEVRQPSRTALLTRRRVLVACATAMLAALVILQVAPVRQSDDDVALFVESHQALRAASADQEVPPVALRALESGFDFAVRLPESLPARWRLVDVDRLTCSRGLPVAHLYYADGPRKLSVFEKPAYGGPGPGMGMGRGRGGRGWGGSGGMGLHRFRGQPIAASADAEMRFFVVGDLPAEQLQRLANDLASQGSGQGAR